MISYVTINDPGDSSPLFVPVQLRYTKCSCGSTHETPVMLSEEQQRAANRERVAARTYTTEYAESSSEYDAWQMRTLNLDSLVTQERI